MPSEWTAEDIENLKRLWPTTGATELARILGKPSRSAVIGKAFRLGLTKRPKKKPEPPKIKVVDPEPVDDLEANPEPVPGLPAGFTMATIPPRGRCCWPDDVSRKRPATAWCGQPALKGSFCRVHAKRAFQPAKKLDLRGAASKRNLVV